MHTFTEVIAHRAQTQAQDPAYRFFRGAALVPEVLTFQELWVLSAALATKLQDDGLIAGMRVLLICKSQRNFVVAFYACLLAGIVAVPTAPPRRQNTAARMQLLIGDSDASAIIVDDAVVTSDEVLPVFPATVIDMREFMAGAEHAALAQRWTFPKIDGDSLAFLQYTSGSTSEPKGVMVTHANLLDNCALIQEGMGFTPASSIFTALPLFHDMGLVGGILESMFAGCSGNCMEPAEFVQYPERWLKIISAYRITISGGPNFMYEIAARSITAEQLEGCDLSSWKVAFCGAEPIRAATVELFTNKFASVGFKPNAFYPCYGMAEATLFITGKAIEASPLVSRDHGSAVVSCGFPRGGMQVEIVDPQHHCRVGESVVGEIWVRGASVAQGYWNKAELCATTFQAKIAGGDGSTFMRTGDLGYLKDGQLYVTGRLKDLIIMYGKKYAPQDIEHDAENAHIALREGCGAAFAVAREGTDRLVLVMELRREWLRKHQEWPAVSNSIRGALSATHGVRVDDIVFIKTGALPRTSSGKVRRSQCRSDYLENKLDRVAVPQ